jgi:hypothetical protein
MSLSFENGLIRKAVSALLSHEEKKTSGKRSSSLLGGFAKPIQVQVYRCYISMIHRVLFSLAVPLIADDFLTNLLSNIHRFN